jgi:SAM-dependent methyltransferase
MDTIASDIPKGANVLEIGGGTGQQAKMLADRGVEITSIDIEHSTYSDDRVYNVIDYDGKLLPFPDNSFDIIFSSNVLEHVLDLKGLHKECVRVMKNDGHMIHIMPSHIWRAATNMTHYLELVRNVFTQFYNALRGSLWPHRILLRLLSASKNILKLLITGLLPERHGERGNVFSEVYYFHPSWWRQHFKQNDLAIMEEKPMGLFYTGYMFLGAKLSMEKRRKLAMILGSACIMFKLKPE